MLDPTLVDDTLVHVGKSATHGSAGAKERDIAARAAAASSHTDAQFAFRVDKSTIEGLNATLQKYVGTHDFYNFTRGRKSGDSSCKRYIKHFYVAAEPVIMGDLEWLRTCRVLSSAADAQHMLAAELGHASSTTALPHPPSSTLEFFSAGLNIHGQSFMLHQIRLMVGAALAVARGHTPELLETALHSTDRVHVPMAPAEGLYLDRPCFDFFNKRTAHEKLELGEGLVGEKLEAFKRDQIIPHIVATEQELKPFLLWSSGLNAVHWDDARGGGFLMDTSA